MDAVKYIKEKTRMCKSCEDCMECGFHPQKRLSEKKMGCSDYIINYPEEAVKIVEKWSQEHPQKTMLQDFLEKYPKANLNNDGIPNDVCPDALGYEEEQDWCDGKCVACWNRPLEE